jgi:DNA-binding response OmpR family regulator
MSTVMVVDDDERVRTFLTRSLATQGHTVVLATDGADALEQLPAAEVDLMLLDLVMPRCNGLQVLAELGRRDAAPAVIVLSGVDEVAARVQALDRGAADFVSKPFHLAELLARVRRHLQERPRERGDDRYLNAGGITLDLDRRRATTGGADVTLTEREFALLAHLMRRRGQVCGRDELLHDVWGLSFDPGSNVVEVCVRRVRAKLPHAPLETVRGAGYCFYGR